MCFVTKKIVLATRNQDKIKEIRELLNDLDIELLTLGSFSEAPEVVEDGETLEENSIKKAKVISEFTKMTAVADDTGLEVDSLNGAPGVYSSRYSGENATYAQNVEKLLRDLKGVPWKNRGAQFRCVVALINENDRLLVEGVCRGVISEEPQGSGGFGYDPVFFVPEHDCTFAEMSLDLKNRISHRAKAFIKVRNLLQQGKFTF